MEQKIVIKVQMNSDKCRTKAMKIAATTDGVSSVAIQGSENDQLVVSGEGVDSANLTRSLRKKLCYATILSVEEVKKKADTSKETTGASASVVSFSQFPAYYQPFPNYYHQVIDDPYPNNCAIM
ncbi:heavy metal-associated isoprenylated plant protein 47-like [Corylus avellana]|uniref:heavy metal-associated isoprenylated plant protein 47-like n=1 Tax=Corylus avellana TaxID=13451 RepID=UPI001E203155|nr:heavy metal-associated isoprenylated plant protein 47-like [Corylus avellana]